MSVKVGDTVFVPSHKHAEHWYAHKVADVREGGRLVFVWMPNPGPHGPSEYQKMYYRSELRDANMRPLPAVDPARPSFVSRVVARLWRK